MKTLILKKLFLLLLLITSTVAVNGQQSDSLAYFLETAAKNNPTVMQRYQDYQASLQKVPQVGSLPDPQLEIGVFLSPMELISGNQVADIKLMQMFPWFGVIKNAKDEMSLMAKAKFETFRDAKLQVYYDVQRSWFDLYKVRQNIRISEKNFDLLKTIERLTLVKYKSSSASGSSTGLTSKMSGANVPTVNAGSSGMNTMGGNSAGSTVQATIPATSTPMGSVSGGTGLSEVYQIQIEMGDLENNIASLKNEEQVIVARFNGMLNRNQKTQVTGVETLPTEPLDITYLTVNDSMFLKNPMLGMYRYEQQSLESRKKMQNKMGLPMVGLGLNYTVINKSDMSSSPMNGKDMIMPMLVVTLPIYRSKYKAMQSESVFLKKASEQNYQAASNELQTEYYEALQLYNDAQRRMKLFESQRKLAQKTLDILIKSFSTSNSNLTDLLRVRQQLFDYEFKEVEAVSDFNRAEAWIIRLIIR